MTRTNDLLKASSEPSANNCSYIFLKSENSINCQRNDVPKSITAFTAKNQFVKFFDSFWPIALQTVKPARLQNPPSDSIGNHRAEFFSNLSFVICSEPARKIVGVEWAAASVRLFTAVYINAGLTLDFDERQEKFLKPLLLRGGKKVVLTHWRCWEAC